MAEEVWVSDKSSYFAHLSRFSYPANSTKCGISLGSYDWSMEDLVEVAKGKPQCSACLEGVLIFG